MTAEAPLEVRQLPIRDDLFTGIDVGGTKVHILDTRSTTVYKYNTTEYEDLDTILDKYFQKVGVKPAKVAVGMAGARDDETGEIKLTKANWSAFNPQEASLKYDTKFMTVNDMVATTIGVTQETGVDLLPLKPGLAKQSGTKLIVALSTGFGAAGAVWDERSGRYVVSASEGGHMGFQPTNREEQEYLSDLHNKHDHVSIQLAMSGGDGIDNLIDHSLVSLKSDRLLSSIEKARLEERPVGAVLLEYATEGSGLDQRTAQVILRRLGAMVGSATRSLALAYMSTGGVYLTGSVSLGLGEYFAEQTDFNRRFVHEGAEHDTILRGIPINLVTDPNVAVVGALALAKGL